MASRSHSVRCPCCQPPSEEQLRKLFNNHDANRDASLSKKEIEKAFDELGSTVPGWRARRALRRADSDRNGFIDDEEEMARLGRRCPGGELDEHSAVQIPTATVLSTTRKRWLDS
nr:putative calcium-binding protein CML10 [Ipomoea batatas]